MNLSVKQKQNLGHRDTLGVAKGGRLGGGRQQEVGVSRGKLLHRERINKVLLYSTGDCTCSPVINDNGNIIKRIHIHYIHVWMYNWTILLFRNHKTTLWINCTSIKISLVVQWLRICLSMQETPVWPLVGKIPHAGEQRSPHATTINTEPHLLKPAWLEPALCSKRSRLNTKGVHRKEEQPLLSAPRESPCAAMNTQSNQKYIKIWKTILQSKQ